MKNEIVIIVLVGVITLASQSTSFALAQNSSVNEQGVAIIDDVEELTSDIANFSFVESIGNVTESLVNATAITIGNISSNQTENANNNMSQEMLGNPTELIANSTQTP